MTPAPDGQRPPDGGEDQAPSIPSIPDGPPEPAALGGPSGPAALGDPSGPAAPGGPQVPTPRPRMEFLSATRQLMRGSRALITGGNAGIGRVIAVGLAREGMDVAIAYAPAEPAEDAARPQAPGRRRPPSEELFVENL